MSIEEEFLARVQDGLVELTRREEKNLREYKDCLKKRLKAIFANRSPDERAVINWTHDISDEHWTEYGYVFCGVVFAIEYHQATMHCPTVYCAPLRTIKMLHDLNSPMMRTRTPDYNNRQVWTIVDNWMDVAYVMRDHGLLSNESKIASWMVS